MADLVAILANALPTLTHPNIAGEPAALPTAAFRAGQNLPPEVAEAFALEAGLPHADTPRLYAEAIAHTIEQAGLTVVTTADAARLTAGEPERVRQVNLRCWCGADLLSTQVRDGNTDTPSVYGPQFIAAVGKLTANCATGHRS